MPPPSNAIRLDPMVVLMLMLIAGIALAGLTAPARAHAIVVTSTPAANAVVPAGALEITLTFNSRLDPVRSRLSLEGPRGITTAIALRDVKAPTAIGGHTEVRTAGRWKVRWQVLAADGHITRGEIPFRVQSVEPKSP